MSWKTGMAALALISVAGAACPNQNQPRDSKSLLRMEDFWVQALVHRSSTELNCLLAPEFADSDWKGGRLNRAQVLQAAANRPPLPQGAQHHFEEMSARIFGNVGMVNGLSYWIYADGSKHSLARFTDVFVYRHGRWLAVAGQETAVSRQ